MQLVRKIIMIMSLVEVAIGAQAQLVLRGIAVDSKNHPVQVVVNDTLQKLWRAVPDQPVLSAQQKQLAERVALQAQNLITAEQYVLTTDSLGKFKLEVRVRDSVQFSSYSHVPQRLAVQDLLRQPEVRIKLVPQPCQEYKPCQNTKPAHFVFIGSKKTIRHALQPYYCNRIVMDSKFTARYQVVKNVYNTLPDSVLEFTVYDHYGWPQFSHYDTVLLFVSRYCGEYVHEKYQYYPLYKTADGRWAAPVKAEDLEHPMIQSAPKPRRIVFATPIEMDVATLDSIRLKQYYPAPYYRIASGKAVAEYGNYVEELVEIKKKTILKARGIQLK